MDAVNRALDSASHAIWGETHPQHQQHGEEPLSGVQGRGTATDPYDAGNREDPTGNNSSPLSPAINEEVESQLGSGPADGSTGFASANIPSAATADEPSYGTDLSALDSALNRSRIPEGRRIGSNPLGTGEGDMEATTGIHSGLGQAERTSINPTMMMAGGVGGGGALAGTSAAAAEAAGLGAGGHDSGPSFEQRAQGAAGGGSSDGGGGYGGRGEQHSKEALMGPQSPPPRAEYDFEKELDAGRTAKDSAQEAKTSVQNQPRQHSSAMSKVKERLHLRHK